MDEIEKYVGNNVTVISKIDMHGIIALEKPIGILCHPNNNENILCGKSILKLPYDHVE